MSDFENGCAGSCDACGSKSDCEKATVTLTLDDGSMMECAILTIFEADEKEYIALLPLDEKGNASEEGDVYLYRFQEINGNPTLDNIESDEEYEMVADAFDEWLDMQNLKIWKTNLFHGAIFLCMLKSPAGFCLQGIF